MNADVVIFVHDSIRHDQQARNPFFPTDSINKKQFNSASLVLQ